MTRSSQGDHKGCTLEKLGAINRKKNLGGSGPPPPRKKPGGKNLTYFIFLFVRIKTHWENLKYKNPAHTYTYTRNL